jgi:hypothetical protein
LEEAMNLASNDLDLPSEIQDGLLRWVLNAAYFLIQVRATGLIVQDWKLTALARTGMVADGATQRDTCQSDVPQSGCNYDTTPCNANLGRFEVFGVQ